VSWWARLKTDLARRITHRGWVLWYLIFERGFRGLLIAGLGAWALITRHLNVAEAVEEIQEQVNLSGTAWWQKLGTSTLHSVLQLTPSNIELIATIAVFYGALELTESAGLILRRRWAEYLVVIATGVGIPLEVSELARHFTVVKVVVTAVNIAVVVYLVWRKHLFQLDAGEAEGEA